MNDLRRSIAQPFDETEPDAATRANTNEAPDVERVREWIVTNGLGGYASGTVRGLPTRRYHGLLIAALPAPLGRMLMLGQLHERLGVPGGASEALGVEALVGRPVQASAGRIREFHLEEGLPVWRFEVGGVTLEKRLLLPHLQNTVHVTYRIIPEEEGGRAASAERSSGPYQLTVRPLVHFRPHDAPVDAPHVGQYRFTASADRYEISAGEIPPLRLTMRGRAPAFTLDAATTTQITYSLEAQRGYESLGNLWSPGYFRVELTPDEPTSLVASVEPWETMLALDPEEATRSERGRRRRMIATARRHIEGLDDCEPPPSAKRRRALPSLSGGMDAELVMAAEQFLITPAGRVEDTARAHAAGEEVRTVIAGYHWFTDWGRDTMISLEGLTLTTGRAEEAGYILLTFAHYIRDGLIPNMFPEGQKQGLYHTADATLWFFHAIDRYVEESGDQPMLQALLPRLVEIVEHHRKGTRFGIGVDPRDGLLKQGAEGYQLTWMDAKVADWVVTPRRGKAVEINALWYNALKLLEEWMRDTRGEDAARPYQLLAEQTRQSFNNRFWYEAGGHLLDVVDGESGDDPACRPNQVFAISLKYPVLDNGRWASVLDVVQKQLLTPVGLRSLAPGHPDYKPRYFGDLRARDAAYHQGTVWAWLIGPFIDAWLKVHPNDRAGARRFLEGFEPHLGEGGLGTISEVFDAEPPYTPRGCIAQAWSVAEVLRCWVKTEGRATAVSTDLPARK
ncbi:MAG: amylo-alpha-1,6-glucosidase [Isosphaeraceae bacterium]